MEQNEKTYIYDIERTKTFINVHFDPHFLTPTGEKWEDKFYDIYPADTRLYIFKKDKKTSIIWVDLDIKKDDFLNILKELKKVNLLPTVIVSTGRHFAVLYLLKKPLDVEKHREVHLLIRGYFERKVSELGYDYKKVIHQLCGEKVEHIRFPETINSKTGKKVKWFLHKDEISYNIIDFEYFRQREGSLASTTAKTGTAIPLSSSPSLCPLFTEADANFKYHRYEGWRFCSYFYAMKDDFEGFYLKSQEWEGKQEQTPAYRFNTSKREIENNQDDFYTCKTLSNMETEALNNLFFKTNVLKEHPCKNCVFKDYPAKPYRITNQKFRFTRYVYKPPYLYSQKGEIVAEFRDIIDIATVRYENETNFLLSLRIGKDIQNFLLPQEFDKLSTAICSLKTEDTKNIVRDLLLSNPTKKEIMGFTGFWKNQWNITPKNYQGYLLDANLDCQETGDFEKWKEAIKFLIHKQRGEVDLALAWGLSPLITNSDYYDENILSGLILIGATGVGKTFLLGVANSFWRPFHQYLTMNTSISRAFLEYKAGRVKGLIALDEFFFNDVAEEMLYTLLNKGTRKTLFTERGYPNTSTFLFTCELNRWSVSKFDTGLSRRLIVADIFTIPSDLFPVKTILCRNAGFLNRFNFNFEDDLFDTVFKALASRLNLDRAPLYLLTWSILLYFQFCKQLEIEYDEDMIISRIIPIIRQPSMVDTTLPLLERAVDLLPSLFHNNNSIDISVYTLKNELIKQTKTEKNLDTEYLTYILKVLCDDIKQYASNRSFYCKITIYNKFLLYKTQGFLYKNEFEDLKEMVKNNIDKMFENRPTLHKKISELFDFFLHNYIREVRER